MSFAGSGFFSAAGDGVSWPSGLEGGGVETLFFSIVRMAEALLGRFVRLRAMVCAKTLAIVAGTCGLSSLAGRSGSSSW